MVAFTGGASGASTGLAKRGRRRSANSDIEPPAAAAAALEASPAMATRVLHDATPPSPAIDDVRDAVRRLPASKIREVANLGMGDESVIPLWFGESDTPTPAFICDAAVEALAAGDTFYQLNLGIPELRDAIAAYMNRLYGTRIGVDRVTVTVSGMNALMLALQAVVGRGDVTAGQLSHTAGTQRKRNFSG